VVFWVVTSCSDVDTDVSENQQAWSPETSVS